MLPTAPLSSALPAPPVHPAVPATPGSPATTWWPPAQQPPASAVLHPCPSAMSLIPINASTCEGVREAADKDADAEEDIRKSRKALEVSSNAPSNSPNHCLLSVPTPANSNSLLANSNAFSAAANASPGSPKPLEPSPIIPDPIIHHQPITLVPLTHSEVSQ
ncbi:hypothetical protein E4T56_gene854 [Termitomyces sp. T112]|nr:hypothetical protein E4T56_gene854 [Termitomyces sp. T112]